MASKEADLIISSDRDKFYHSPLRRVTAEEQDKYKIFEDWLLENGAKMPKLVLKDYGNEVRGCHCTDDIEEEEVIVEVPLKCLITVEMGMRTEIGERILRSNVELDAPKHIFLMIYMLIDRRNMDSFFKPYYDILPPTLSNMPIFWKPHELQYLDGSYILEQIAERNEAIEQDYLAICRLAPEFSSISSLEEFKWARMCVCSRNFGLNVNGAQTAALVPYADMLNHYRPRETKWQFDDQVQAFTIVSLQHIMGGAQVYDSYGRKCNHRFLLNYGFSVENNVEPDGFCPNEVPVYLELRANDPLYEVKRSYYRRDMTVPHRRIRVAVADSESAKLLLAMLRFIEADNDDFELLVANSASSFYRSLRDAQTAISLSNEWKTMQALARLCDDHLDRYPTKFDDDVYRLTYGNVPLFSNERNALIQVKGEKEVLLFYRDFALTAMRLLRSSDLADFDEQLDAVRSTKHSFVFNYCRGVAARLFQEELRRDDRRNKTLDLSKPTVV